MFNYVNFNGSNEPKSNSKTLLEAQQRINKIRDYAKKKAFEEEKKKENEVAMFNDCVKTIANLKERILAVISTANVCLVNDINLDNFIKDDELPLIKFNIGRDGIINSLCLTNFSKWNLFVYPDLTIFVIHSGNTDKVRGIGIEDVNLLLKFIEDFDKFETDVYAYIDKLVSE